jgi:apoptosis-inducing factor 3
MAKKTKKRDLAAGVPAADLVDGAMISGRVGKEAVLLARAGDEIFAISAKCTHYGVRPRTELAEKAGLRTDRGVLVDSFLQTSVPYIFAAGDIARFPYALAGGGAVRVEHWVAVERLGQVAAINMLDGGQRFEQAPFFWSQHYDVPINYVGHAGKWNTAEILGDIKEGDGLVKYRNGGRVVAVASIFRDEECPRAELDLERST